MFQVVKDPSAIPACCLFCPGSAREQYIDTGAQMDYYGAVYICDQCVIAMASQLGCATPERTSQYDRRFKELTNEKFELLKRVAGLEAAVRGLADAGLVPIPQLPDPGVLLPDAQGQGGESQERSEAPQRGLDQVGGGEGTSPESSDDESLAGVHTDDQPDGGFQLRI